MLHFIAMSYQRRARRNAHLKGETSPGDASDSGVKTIADAPKSPPAADVLDPFAKTEVQVAGEELRVAVGAPTAVAASPAAEQDPEIPAAFYARFEAFEFLGRGGMGVVYKARDIRLGRDVAVKLIFGGDTQFGANVLREARSQARIVHEHVCEVYEVGTIDHVRYIVMQLIRGDSLDKAKATMALEEKVRVIRQVADALHEAHRLGMIHRDVKPANIMIERGEDGSWRPYMMDFGLAREVGDSGATVSGTLMGTPAFMAPEQAAGKVRTLDRRTDVYGLGATLYDLLVNRPPLEAEGLGALLHAIVHDVPLAPRQIDSELPLDLDAIVMRCLEKHPASRYESAKVLGDELQRFLDGEPVLALKRARLYALWRRVRRNKLRLTIAAISIVVVSTFVGGWLRARQLAERQASLSRELGENVKEIEFFLRNAHGMPLHDVGRERTIVRRKLERVDALMRAAGDIGRGPGHYALGRGHLALQDYAQALEHLQEASGAGYSSSELDYALGLTLGEIFRKELAQTRRLEGERKKQRIAEIEALYKQPALVHLGKALGESLESPAYAAGLIAFYEGRFEEALAKGREAFDKAPWFYEAKKLEADALFSIGKQYGHDAAFDFEKMSKWYGEADAAYRVAADMGRSDPSIHVAICDLKTKTMNGIFEKGASVAAVFEEAKAACDHAILANPEDNASYLQHAEAYANYVWRIRATDFDAAFAEALPVVQEALRRNPDSAMASYFEASLWRTQAVIVGRVKDGNVAKSVALAIQRYGEALALDPTFAWARSELCAVLVTRGRLEMHHGNDPQPTWKEAASHCEKVLQDEPRFTPPWRNLLALHETTANYLLGLGKSPDAPVRAGRKAIEAAQKLTATDIGLVRFASRFAIVEATYAIEAFQDPTTALERLDAIAAEGAGKAPENTIGWIRAESALLRARYRASKDLDPSTEVSTARRLIAPFLVSSPRVVAYRLKAVETDIIGMQWALRKDALEPEDVAGVLGSLTPFIDKNADEPALYIDIATLHTLVAEALMHRKKDPSFALAKGFAAVEQALGIHPKWAPAYRMQGYLWSLRAMHATEKALKRQYAQQALDAFDKAIALNPLLERQVHTRRAEMRAIAEET